MRNMKRVLSLVLAMVMMLGMLTIPTGAANNFADADQIVNTEAVDITAGMGLFAGSDGKFNPQGTVTRAQMATIIVKMMYGSDFNADSFKGAGNPFPDTAAFEGGWAEGYINACFQLGVVKGYGDGSFKPGNQVTTAEAVTMIINALKIDAGEGEWPNTVMAKATELKLFGDLKPAPATNNALIRDQLAVIVLEGLQCSPSGSNTYTYTTPGGKSFEFPSLEDAMTTIGVENADFITVNPADDTLAKKVYNLKIETGFVTDNQATGSDYTKVNGVYFDVETGLDMIGHYVSVYYQVPKSGQSVEANKVYSVIDDSEVITVSEDATTSKEYRASFSRNYEPAESVLVFESDYSVSEATAITDSYTPGSAAAAGTYIISENKVIAYLKPAAKYASYIASITDFDGEKTYMLGGMMDTIDAENITLYPGAAKDDIVTYVKAKEQIVLEPVDPVKGTVTKIGGNSEDGYVMTLNGQEYELFNGAGNYVDGAELTKEVDVDRFSYGDQYTVYITQDNKVVGWKLTSGATAGEVDVNKIVYAKGAYTATEKDDYGIKTTKHLMQAVDAKGNEVQILLAQGEMLGNYTGNDADYIEGFYVVEDYDGNDKEAKKAGIKLVTPVGLRSKTGTAVGETGLTYADNLFYGANRWGGSTIKMPSSNVNSHICTTACKTLAGGTGPESSRNHSYSDTNDNDKNTYRTFFNGDTKFLMVKGTLGEPLKCAAGGDGFSYTLTGSNSMTLPMLFTEDENGLINVVMVVIPKDPNDLKASYPMIYVTGKVIGSTAAGDLIEGYLASKATATDVLVRPGTSVTKGFKAYTVDDNGWFVMEKSTSDSAYEDMVINAISSSGLMNAFDPNYDSSKTSEKMQTPSGANASKAKILDLRSEANIQASGIGTITTLEQLRTLRENGYVINADIYASTTTVSAIYITSVYKVESNVVYYVTEAGKAGAPVAAYNTKTGALGTVTVTEHSSVLGFATVSEGSYSSALVKAEGPAYREDEIANSMAMSGDNVVITSTNGNTVTVTANTVIASKIGAFASPAAIFNGFSALSEGSKYTFSCIGENGGEASFILITGQGDPYVATGDVLMTTAVLTPGVAGSAAGTMMSGLKANEAHTVTYTDVILPDGITLDSIADTDTIYYTVEKDNDGNVTLTFAYNYKPVTGDMFYAVNFVKKGELSQIYVLGSDTAKDGTLVWMIPTGGSGTNVGVDHFWLATSDTAMDYVDGVWTTGVSGAKYRFAYHDQISAVADKTFNITWPSFGHHGVATCAYSSKYEEGEKYTGVGYFANPCDEKSGPSGDNEIHGTVKYDENQLVIVDRRSAVLNDGVPAVDNMAAVQALCDAEMAIVNVYSSATKKTEAVATFVVVIDPAPNFVPPVSVTVTPAENGTVTVDKALVAVGEVVTIEAKGAAGYELDQIKVNDVAIIGNTFVGEEGVNGYTVTATFKAIPQFKISVGEVVNGTVTLSAQGDDVYRDTVITIETKADKRYKLEAIYVNGEAIEGNTFEVTADAVVTATFVEDDTIYTVTAGACENGSVAVDPASGLSGTDVTVTATADAGYVLDKIYVDGEAIDGNTFQIDGNNVVTATFAKLYQIVEGDCELGSVSVDKPEGYLLGETVTVTATPDAGYELEKIYVNGTAISGNTFKATEEPQEVTATFLYDPQDGDAIFVMESLYAGVVKSGYIAYSGAGVKAGTLVRFMVDGPVNNTHNGSNYLTLRMAYVADGIVTCVQYPSSTYMKSAQYKVGIHEAITKVDEDAGTFTLGKFSDGSHADRASCHHNNNSAAPHKYGGLGYYMGSYGSAGCESTSNECAATQKYDNNTVIIDLSGNNCTTLAQIKALCDTCDVMVDVYVPDGAKSTTGTASLVVVQSICPKGTDCGWPAEG